MKNIVMVGLLFLSVNNLLATSEVNLNDTKTVDVIGLNGLNQLIPKFDKNAAGRAYLYTFDYKKYEEVREDEFLLDDAITESYPKFIEKIKSSESFINKKGVLRLGASFKKYDFKNESFPMDIMEKNSYITFGGGKIVRISNLYNKPLTLSFDNIDAKSAFLNMKKADAKNFVKNRKDKDGNVDRQLTAKYTYILKSYTSASNAVEIINNCQENFKRCNFRYLNGIKLVGHITKIEILGKDNKVLQVHDYE